MINIFFTLFLAAYSMAADTSQNVFAQNDTHVVFSSNSSTASGASDWMSVPSEQFFCGTGAAATAFQGASASLDFSGTTISLKLYADVQGSTAQILVDGVKQDEVNLAGAGDYYFNCNTTEWTTNTLSSGKHTVTIVKDEAPGLLFLQSFTYIGDSSDPSPLVPIVVGVVGGVLLIAAIGFTWFWLRRRSRRRQEAAAVQTFDDHQEAYFAPTPFVPSEVTGTNAAPLLSAEANESTSYFPMTQRTDPFADKSRSHLHLATVEHGPSSPGQDGLSSQIAPSVLHGLVQGLVDRGVPGDTINGAIQGAMMEGQPRTSISQTTNVGSEGSRTTEFTSPPPYHLKN